MNPVLVDNLVDKVEIMHDDLWINIFKYFAKEPVLFNLFNINSQFTRVLDNYFPKNVTIDFNKYVRLNKKSKIGEQVNHVMDYFNRTVYGIIIYAGDVDRVELAIRNILDRNALQLKLLHWGQSRLGAFRNDEWYGIEDVVSRAVNLVDVSIIDVIPMGTVDLSGLVNLRSLNFSISRRTEIPRCVRMPIASLTSLCLAVTNANEYQIMATDLRNVLVASRNTLVSLTLDGVRVSQDNVTEDTITSFVFPNLKCITVTHIVHPGVVIDLKESLLLESISVSAWINAINLRVVGLDFRIHRYIEDIKSMLDSINFVSFSMPDACLENLKSLEFNHCDDAASMTAVGKRLAYGCDQLEYIGVNGNMVTELLNQIPKIIANNKKLRRFGSWCDHELFQLIIQSIIDTKNESLECIEFISNPSDLVDTIGYEMLSKLDELGYERLKKLQIKMINRKVRDDVAADFLSRFNIDFVGSTQLP